MCYVGGMVEETTRETTDHEFELWCSRIYLDVFFLKDGPFSTGQPVPAGAPGTNGGRRPVLMWLFHVVTERRGSWSMDNPINKGKIIDVLHSLRPQIDISLTMVSYGKLT